MPQSKAGIASLVLFAAAGALVAAVLSNAIGSEGHGAVAVAWLAIALGLNAFGLIAGLVGAFSKTRNPLLARVGVALHLLLGGYLGIWLWQMFA